MLQNIRRIIFIIFVVRIFKMFSFIYTKAEFVFDALNGVWHSVKVHRWISRVLAIIFLVAALTGWAAYKSWIPASWAKLFLLHPFGAIEVAFSLLLITEIFSLLFVLPISVAQSVGKQFELLSLIFIRYAFKEFSHIHSLQWADMKLTVWHMFFYAFGSIFIFLAVGLLYHYQKKTRICEVFTEDRYFVRFRKTVALGVLLIFILILFNDFYRIVINGVYAPSFHDFYSVLIFSDILILLVSIRYSLDYHSMYRYSGYILATIFIRIALTADPYYNILIGMGGVIYVLFLTLTYNYFLHRNISVLPHKMHYNYKKNRFGRQKFRDTYGNKRKN